MAIKKLRIGVTGLGRIGWEHCRNLAQHKDYLLAAVADPCGERRAEAAALSGCQAYDTHGEMLANARLDAVVIASPTHLHKAMSVAAFKRGLHVFLEKPMAMNVAEAQAIASAARRARRKLTVYQPHRAHAYFQQIRRIVESGKLGEIYHIKGCWYNFVRRNDWQALRKFGGGMLNNYGAHMLDLLLALGGRDVKRLFCQLRLVGSLGDAEDVVRIVYETRGGVICEAEINQATAASALWEMEIHGTHGALRKEGKTLNLRWFSPRQLAKKSLHSGLASEGRKYPSDRPLFKEESIEIAPRYTIDIYADFAKAIRSGAEPFVKPAETLSVMRLLERCRRDAGRIVATPL